MTQLTGSVSGWTELLADTVVSITVVLLSLSLFTSVEASWLFMTTVAAAMTSSTRLDSSLWMTVLLSGATITTFGMSSFGRRSVVAASTLLSVDDVTTGVIAASSDAVTSSPSSVMCSSSSCSDDSVSCKTNSSAHHDQTVELYVTTKQLSYSSRPNS